MQTALHCTAAQGARGESGRHSKVFLKKQGFECIGCIYNRGQWRELVEGDVREESRTGLSRLLMQVLGEEEDDDVRKINVVARKRQIELREDVGLMEEAFSALCNGLVELSSMPKYQQEEEVEEDILRRVTDEEDGLPMWLLGLLVCCKLEEGDEAGIRIQVKFHIFFLQIFT